MQTKKVSPEIVFAQQLASNFEPVRNKAFKKLRKWLSARSAGRKPISRDEFLKVWKGLFYCMWMRDKLLLQEHLAEDISMLIHSFQRPKLCLLFVDTFFETMAREWNGIDYLRMDKFMMLVRRFFRESLQFLCRLKWKPIAVHVFLKVLRKTVLHPTCDQTPNGLKIHFSDIYLQELTRIGGREFTPSQSLRFLAPCCHFLAYVENLLLRQAFTKNVFLAILELSVNSAFEVESEEDDDEDNEDEEDDDDGLKRFDFHSKILKENAKQLEANQDLPSLPLKLESLAKLLIKYGSKEDVKQKNRNHLYELAKKFRDLAAGVNPLEKGTSEPSAPELTYKDVAKAVQRGLKEMDKEAEEDLKWNKEDMDVGGGVEVQDLLQEEFESTTFEEFGEGKATMKKLKADRTRDEPKKKSAKEGRKKQKRDGDVSLNVKKTSKLKAKVPPKKKVKFSLTSNSSQDPSKAQLSVKGITTVAFDASRKPKQSAIKKSHTNSKVSVQKKKSSVRKRSDKESVSSKRMKACDFF